MNILGISAGFHDAAVCVLNRWGEIEFASQSERYSKRKNDARLDYHLINHCLRWNYDTIAYYESPWRHQLARLVSGQGFNGGVTTRGVLRDQLESLYASQTPPQRVVSYRHHLSHAAAGFQTSPFNEAAVVVIDAVGELDTISIYRAWYDNTGQARYKRVWRQGYPHSIGLFYSAVTKHVGLQPMEDEYITMGMAAYGRADRYHTELHRHLIKDVGEVKFKENLHCGLPDEFADARDVDLAAGTQAITEELIRSVLYRAQRLVNTENLVYMGGVALNCTANRFLGDYFGKIWIMPAPGDAGSSVGAAALAYGRRVHWRDAYLGHSIGGEYPVAMALARLESHGIVGVAHGAAEFGPRALGNRSLLADPRGQDIKDRVNDIKKRQQFRPFAPVILEELVENYFDMPRGWHHNPYMQAVAPCKHAAHFPAIVHRDGTSRVQTVSKDCRSGIRQLLEAWYAQTGCPMLLNTSLNVKGEPMVNDHQDAERFERLYGVPVLT